MQSSTLGKTTLQVSSLVTYMRQMAAKQAHATAAPWSATHAEGLTERSPRRAAPRAAIFAPEIQPPCIHDSSRNTTPESLSLKIGSFRYANRADQVAFWSRSTWTDVNFR